MGIIIKPIYDFDGYFISDTGDVYCNLGKGRRIDKVDTRVAMYKIKPRPTKNGYMRVYMRQTSTNKRKDMYIHRLVATYFVSNPYNKNVVNHIDCDRSNNNSSNLEWVTTKENVAYAMELNHLKRDKTTGRFAS